MTLNNDPKSIVMVSELLANKDLPDPTLRVPFERFASLKDSPDMLVRAAFWCFYSAWMQDGTDNPATPNHIALAVEARHDGHQLRAITNELSIRDCALITRADLDALTEAAKGPKYVATLITLMTLSGALIGFLLALMLFAAIGLTW